MSTNFNYNECSGSVSYFLSVVSLGEDEEAFTILMVIPLLIAEGSIERVSKWGYGDVKQNVTYNLGSFIARLKFCVDMETDFAKV